MSQTPPGCLLFALPARLLGLVSPALGARAWPTLDPKEAHRQDLPALVRARASAERIRDALERRQARVSAAVAAEVVGHVAGLLDRIFAIGARLAEGRRFLEANAPEHLARERARIELERLGAPADRLIALKQTAASLERRASHLGQLASEVSTLADRLEAAAAELQELEAKLAADLGSEDLLHELRAWEQSATLALDAFTATLREIDRS